MNNPAYLPDLDDADFRRLIDARRLVMIRFWEPGAPLCASIEKIFQAAADRHPEVAFAQSDVSEHPGLAKRTMVQSVPTIQGWVDGNLFFSHAGMVSTEDMDEMALRMVQKPSHILS